MHTWKAFSPSSSGSLPWCRRRTISLENSVNMFSICQSCVENCPRLLMICLEDRRTESPKIGASRLPDASASNKPWVSMRSTAIYEQQHIHNAFQLQPCTDKSCWTSLDNEHIESG